jgi:hypothetical protein
MTTTTTRTTTTGRVRAADVATATAAGFLVLLGLLHAIRPELSPTWRMVSEYAIGTNGWMMSTAFLLLGTACVATIVAVTPLTGDRAGRVGRVALGIAAAGLLLAGLATTDPVTATPEQFTTEGNLHGLAAMIGMPAFLIAAIALNRSLHRQPAVSSRTIGYASTALVIAAVVFAVSMAVLYHGAPSDPTVRLGIQNRILVAAYAAWVMVTARVTRTTSP